MKIRFESKEQLFSANEETQARDFLYNTKPMNAKVFKKFMASKFSEYVRDNRCEKPLEKYQQFEDFVINVVASRKEEFGLKGIDLNSLTMFNNSIPTPYMNKDFRNQIAKLSTSDYKKVITGLKDEIRETTILNNQDFRETNLKIRNMNAAREERNPFVKFFLWLFGYTKDEDAIFDDIDELVSDKCELEEISIENEPELLTVEDYEKAKKLEKKTERVPFSIYDPDLEDELEERPKENKPLSNLRFKLAENVKKLEAIENAGILKTALDEYIKREEGFKYSKDQIQESRKELKDMAKVLGVSEQDLFASQNQKNPLSYLLERSKTKFTKEEIEEYEKTAPKKEEDVKEIQSENDELLI